MLKTLFQSISEAPIDTELSKLYIVQIEESENIFVSWNKGLELDDEPYITRHPITEVEKKRELIIGLPI